MTTIVRKETLSHALLIAAVILMDILAAAELDLFVPSFPELQGVFSISTSLVEALLSINFCGFVLGLIFVGELADRYGYRPVIISGLLLFIAGSIVCTAMSSFWLLLVGRFLQGFGASAPSTLCFLIIADVYSMKRQQSLLAWLNVITNTSVAIAPIVGSYITLYFHARGNFIALLLFGIFVLFMTLAFIPKKMVKSSNNQQGIAGYLIIFRSKPLMLLMVNLLFTFMPYWIFVGISPILYIKDLGVSLEHFGYYQGALAFTFALGSAAFSPFIKHCDPRKILNVSAYLYVASFAIFLIVTLLNSSNPLIITLSYIPFNASVLIPSIILYPLYINLFPELKGKVSVLIQAARLILTAIALELAGYCYQGSFRSIGLIMCTLMAVSVVTMFMILKDEKLMNAAATKD